MAITAKFKTAYLQHTNIAEVTAASKTVFHVGDLVEITKAGVISAKSGAASAADLTAPTAGSHYAIIAQSDISMAALDPTGSSPYKHVSVEDKNLQFDDTVTVDTTKKKISVFYIIDPNDVVLSDYTTPEQLA